jgi:hypothetical protein
MSSHLALLLTETPALGCFANQPIVVRRALRQGHGNRRRRIHSGAAPIEHCDARGRRSSLAQNIESRIGRDDTDGTPVASLHATWLVPPIGSVVEQVKVHVGGPKRLLGPKKDRTWLVLDGESARWCRALCVRVLYM